MRPAQLLQYIRIVANAFYRFLLKISINAHQVIAHWRARIRREQRVVKTSPTAPISVELQQQIGRKSTTNEPSSSPRDQLHRQHPEEPIHHLSAARPSQQSGLLATNTPNSRRLKIYSIFRRLSIRNFMEYCVIALNEASGSSSSNKFDLAACDRPVWLLGQRYELPRDADKLVEDIRSKLWITYRRNFPPIDENTRYTTDRGFGCMIRCGQMVLANALLYKNLGRDWRWSPTGLEANPEVYTRILKLFQDKEQCPYSIHNIVRTGQQEGKLIGEWFGPNTIAQALKRLATALSLAGPTTNNEVLISIDAALDNVVVVEEIKARFKRSSSSSSSSGRNSGISPTANKNGQEKLSSPEDGGGGDGGGGGDVSGSDANHSIADLWVPGILFIQLRLGLTKINPLYFAALRKTFQFKSSLGIIGGRPNHALYLIGYTDDDIIYLDPHSTQQYIDFDSDDIEERLPEDLRSSPLDSTYHCACPEKMAIDRLDPSLALCFYFHTEHEFDEWCSLSDNLLIKSEQAPMFEITESRPSGWEVSVTSQPASTIVEQPHLINDDGEKITILKDDYEPEELELGLELKSAEEEFEMLG